MTLRLAINALEWDNLKLPVSNVLFRLEYSTQFCLHKWFSYVQVPTSLVVVVIFKLILSDRESQALPSQVNILTRILFLLVVHLPYNIQLILGS